MASTVRAHARCRAGLAAAGAAALIALTAVTAGPAAAAMRLPAGQAARAGLAAVATAAWPGASRQALAGPRSQLPVFVLDKGRFRAFDIPFGEFGGDSVTINDRGQIAGSYYDDPAATCLRDFLRDRNGRFTRIDFPAPAPPSCWTSTIAARSPAATGRPPAARAPTLCRCAVSCATSAAGSPRSRSPGPGRYRPSASTPAARSWATTSRPTAPPTATSVTTGGSLPSTGRPGQPGRPFSTSTTTLRWWACTTAPPESSMPSRCEAAATPASTRRGSLTPSHSASTTGVRSLASPRPRYPSPRPPTPTASSCETGRAAPSRPSTSPAVFGTAVFDINNAGAVVGVGVNPDAAAGPLSASTTPDMPPNLPRQAEPAASR